MDAGMSPVVLALKEKFPHAVFEAEFFREETTVAVPKGDILEICRFLRFDPALQFELLTDLCGIDFFPQVPRFAVVYHLCSMKTKQRVRLRAQVGENESIASVESVWKIANWYEREAYDLFGIPFDHHPDLRRILLWDGYDGHPLRKDYPIEGPDFDKPFVPEA
jgi:NADH-quinone oxidoreductase subunit C